MAIYTASEAQKQLLNSNRDYNNRLTWQNAIQGVNASANASLAQLEKQYASATADAYTSYLKNKNALEASGAVGTGLQNLLQENYNTLEQAYNSYQQSLLQGQAQVQQAANEQMENIYGELEQQAQNSADYTNAHLDYLQSLWDAYEAGENTLFDDPYWTRFKAYYEPTYDEDGNIVYDFEGNVVHNPDIASLINSDELEQIMFTDGQLNEVGIDILRQLENDTANRDLGVQSWNDYLTETNPELAEWAQSSNPYNYTPGMTNAATMRELYGLSSDDYTYENHKGNLKLDSALNKAFIYANDPDTFDDFDVVADSYWNNYQGWNTLDDISVVAENESDYQSSFRKWLKNNYGTENLHDLDEKEGKYKGETLSETANKQYVQKLFDSLEFFGYTDDDLKDAGIDVDKYLNKAKDFSFTYNDYKEIYDKLKEYTNVDSIQSYIK